MHKNIQKDSKVNVIGVFNKSEEGHLGRNTKFCLIVDEARDESKKK